jgi:hypothetical protein
MNKKLSRLFPAVILTAACLASNSFAQVVLLGNYPPSNDGTGSSASDTVWKAVSFTMPAQDYDVNAVKLRLSNFTTVDNPRVSFYLDNAGNPDTGGSAYAVMNDAAATSDPSSADFTFAPAGTVTLHSGTTYWLVVQDEAVGQSYTWNASTSDTPTSRNPTGIINPWTGSYKLWNGASWSTSATRNSFEITVVPEPAQYTAAGAGALVVFGAIRRYLNAK